MIKINPEDIQKILDFIKRGEVLIFPTDTIYGLVADATNPEAVEKVFKIKSRSFKKVISVFVSGIKVAEKYTEIKENQKETIKNFWPGKITFILKAINQSKLILPKGIVSKQNKIGLRNTDFNLIKKVIDKLDIPLTATSANISGRPSSNKIKEVISQFESRSRQPAAFVNGGSLKESEPSTVVDLTSFPPQVLRKGAIEFKK